jgi:predicted Zn-ribbon and HTH transcriptional regulator
MTSAPTRICAREGCSNPVPDLAASPEYCCGNCVRKARRAARDKARYEARNEARKEARLQRLADLPQQYCKKCGWEFPRGSRTNQKFCSPKCRSDYNNEKRDVSTRVRGTRMYGNWNLDHCPFKAGEVRMYDACGAICARMPGVWGF